MRVPGGRKPSFSDRFSRRSRARGPGLSPLTSHLPAPRIPPLYEAHLPAQQPAPQAHARLPRPDADAVRPCRHLGPPSQGAQKTHGVNSGPVVSETFSRDDRLRKRREFEECYASGVRVSGRHIQVFLLADLGDRRAHAPGDLGSAPRGQRRAAQPGAAAAARDLPALAQPLRRDTGCGSSSTRGRRPPRRPSRSSRRTTPRASRGRCRGCRGDERAARAAPSRSSTSTSAFSRRSCRAPAGSSRRARSTRGRRSRATASAAAAGSPSAGSCAATRSIGAASTRCPEGDISGKTPSRRRRTLARASCSTWEWIGPKPPKRVAPLVETPAAAAAATPAAGGATPRRRERDGRPCARPPCRPPPSAEAETLTTVLQRRPPGHVLQPRSGALTSFVLTGHFDEQKQPLELRAQAAAGISRGRSASTSARTPRRRRRSPRRSSSSSANRTASCACATPIRVDRRRQGDPASARATSSTSRSPSRDPPTACSSGPGLRNPTEAERGSRYVMPASAVGATSSGMKIVSAEKASDKNVWALPAKGFAGIEDNYFLEVLVPNAPSTARALHLLAAAPGGQALARRSRPACRRPGDLRGRRPTSARRT